MKAPRLTTVFACILLPLSCAAVRPYTPVTGDPVLEPWRWHQEEVLSGLGTMCMAEAKDGTLWFGSANITRYDGIAVSHIRFDDAFLAKITHRKKNPRAKAITILPDGSPLVLVGESLVRRSGGEWQVIIHDVGRSVFTGRLEQAEDGSIWLLVPDFLWRVSADLSDVSIVMKAPEGGFLGSCSFDPAGNLWVIEKTDTSHVRLVQFPYERGRIEQGTETVAYTAPFPTDATEIWLTAGNDGRIWYGDDSVDTALAIFDPKGEEWSWCDASPKERYFCLFTGRDGTIWAGGQKLILRVSPEGESRLYASTMLPLPQVPLSLYETDDNRLWIIGRVGYVHSVDLGFSQWMTYEQLHIQCESSDGTRWFRSKQPGVVVSHDPDSGTWTQYETSDGLIDLVTAITASSHGLIWATGRHDRRAALAVFDGTNWTRFRHPEFAERILPKAVMEAADGTMWFGAGGPRLPAGLGAGGILQYGVGTDGAVKLLEHRPLPGLPYFVTSMAQAADRSVWVGSTFVYRYRDSSQPAAEEVELQGLNSVDMVFDQDGTLWIAKEHGGVYQQQGESWKLFSIPEGLAGVHLSDLLALRDGTLLASSGSGISRFDGTTWTTHAYPEWWTMCRRRSGMFQSVDGSIWFNFEEEEAQPAQLILNQTERFRTIRHRAETTPPDTRITLHLKRVAQPGNTHISWSAHDPWGDSPSEEIQYSWRLNDEEWSAYSHDTSRTFLNLPSGSHALEVRARDRSFNVDPVPDRIVFTVIPPIWVQTWFIALFASFSALIVVLVWLYVRARERHLLEQQRAREEHLKEVDQMKTSFFTNISHELRTPVTLISGPLKRLLETESDEQKRTLLSMALRNATRVWTLATQLLDFRRLEQGQMEVVPVYGHVAPHVSETVGLFQEMARTNRVECRFVCEEEFEGWFVPETLKKIVQNLVGNAIKYTAPDGEVTTVLSDTVVAGERMLMLAVEDTGSGIAPEYLPRIFDRFYRIPEESIVDGSGIGLNLTKELVDLLGGSLQAESPIHDDPSRPGARFTVMLPLDGSAPGEDEERRGRDDG